MNEIQVGYLYGDGGCPGQFVDSIFEAVHQNHDLIAGRISYYTGPRIAAIRNRVAANFLDTDSEWLWFVDTDMGFHPETPRWLLDTAVHNDAKVMGALCFGKDANGQVFPTIYVAREGGVQRWDYGWPTDRPFQVLATGAACILIHRDVFEAIDAPEPYRWFQETQYGKAEIGEDVTFCLRAAKAGYDTFVHPGIRTFHFKRDGINYEHWADQQTETLSGSLAD
jgi:GT2 family glycosyltransferase